MSKEEYISQLKLIGSLSKLFSESNKPYLYYRIAENIYSKTLNASNVGRSDIAIDAVIGKTGVGLKTFTGHPNKLSYQKIAEFNSHRPELESILTNSNPKKFVVRLSELRNGRLDLAINLHKLDNLIYHLVVRDEHKFSIVEETMHHIDISTIKNIKNTNKRVTFSDKNGTYKFVKSKSTLYKQFNESNPSYSFSVDVLDDPIDSLYKILSSFSEKEGEAPETYESIILPLYSTRPGKDYGEVLDKSGLNLWNAAGRKRNRFEVYIPVPSWIHASYNGFFPKKDTTFKAILPDNKIISMKICQEGGKALMSNPNSELGKWLITEILKIPERTLITKKMLGEAGIDSVEVTKKDATYHLELKSIGSFESFKEENLID